MILSLVLTQPYSQISGPYSERTLWVPGLPLIMILRKGTEELVPMTLRFSNFCNPQTLLDRYTLL